MQQIKGYTETEKAAIVDKFDTIKYDNTTEAAITKLAEQYSYGDEATIKGILKEAGINI